jgi:hypothetical protein
MSDERVRELVSNESKRFAPLPIHEQVRQMEVFLDRHGLLGRAERLINQLIESRVRWRKRSIGREQSR